MLRSVVFASLAVALSSASAFAQSPVIDPAQPVIYTVVVHPEKRPASLLPLYAAQGVLHGLDVYSTFRGIDNGRVREANPLLKNGGPKMMIGVKIGATAATILVTERLWKRHPKLAVVTMIATNAFLSAVTVNNFRLGS